MTTVSLCWSQYNVKEFEIYRYIFLLNNKKKQQINRPLIEKRKEQKSMPLFSRWLWLGVLSVIRCYSKKRRREDRKHKKEEVGVGELCICMYKEEEKVTEDKQKNEKEVWKKERKRRTRIIPRIKNWRWREENVYLQKRFSFRMSKERQKKKKDVRRLWGEEK